MGGGYKQKQQGKVFPINVLRATGAGQLEIEKWNPTIGYRNAPDKRYVDGPTGYYRMSDSRQAEPVSRILAAEEKTTDFFRSVSGKFEASKSYSSSEVISTLLNEDREFTVCVPEGLTWVARFNKKELREFSAESVKKHRNDLIEVPISAYYTPRSQAQKYFRDGTYDVVFTRRIEGSNVVLAAFKTIHNGKIRSSKMLRLVGDVPDGESHFLKLKSLGFVPTIYDFEGCYQENISEKLKAGYNLPVNRTYPAGSKDHDGEMLLLDAIKHGSEALLDSVKKEHWKQINALVIELVTAPLGDPEYLPELPDYARSYEQFAQIVHWAVYNNAFKEKLNFAQVIKQHLRRYDMQKEVSIKADIPEENIRFYPCAMAALSGLKFQLLMSDDNNKQVAYSSQIYYESARTITHVVDAFGLQARVIAEIPENKQAPDVAFLELLGSNADAKSQKHTNIAALIKGWLSKKNTDKDLAVVIDATFGMFNHDVIQRLQTEFADEIGNGLQIHLVMSLAKADPTLGSDTAPGGLYMHFGNKPVEPIPNAPKSSDSHIAQPTQNDHLEQFFSWMFQFNHELDENGTSLSQRYFELVIDNARYLRGKLDEEGVELASSEDDLPYITVCIDPEAVEGNEFSRLMQLQIPRTTACRANVASRSSLGFPLVSINHISEKHMRISVGLESTDVLDSIAKEVAAHLLVVPEMNKLVDDAILRAQGFDKTSDEVTFLGSALKYKIREEKLYSGNYPMPVFFDSDGNEIRVSCIRFESDKVYVNNKHLPMSEHRRRALYILVKAKWGEYVALKSAKKKEYDEEAPTQKSESKLQKKYDKVTLIQTSPPEFRVDAVCQQPKTFQLTMGGNSYDANSVMRDGCPISQLSGSKCRKLVNNIERNHVDAVVAQGDGSIELAIGNSRTANRTDYNLSRGYEQLGDILAYVSQNTGVYKDLEKYTNGVSEMKGKCRDMLLGWIGKNMMQGESQGIMNKMESQAANNPLLLPWLGLLSEGSLKLEDFSESWRKCSASRKSQDMDKTCQHVRNAMGVLSERDFITTDKCDEVNRILSGYVPDSNNN